MSRFIMKNKIYDTEKAEKLCEWTKQWEELSSLLGYKLYPYKNTTLYRTKGGNYFCVAEFDFGKLRAQLLTENGAKQVLMYHNYDRYCELYEPLEEG